MMFLEMLGDYGYVLGMIGKWYLLGYEYYGVEYELIFSDYGFDW